MRRDRALVLNAVGDPVLLAGALVLAALGIGMIWSAGQVDIPSGVTGAWRRQSVWLCISIVGFAVATRVPMRWLEWATPWIYALSIILLLAVLVVGVLLVLPLVLLQEGLVFSLVRGLTGGKRENQRDNIARSSTTSCI